MFVFGMDPFPRELQRLPHQVLGMQQRLHLPNVRVTPTRTASRCLFGVADPTATRSALDLIFREEAERCKEKWEFDPKTGKPVENPKRYVWEKFPREERPTPPVVCPAREVAKDNAGERTDQTSLPADAAPLPGKESGGHRRGKQSDPAAVEASLPAREGDDGEGGHEQRAKPTCQDDGAAIRARDEVERTRAKRRFAPYRQHRITDFWRAKKSSGEAKAMTSQASSDATGAEEVAAEQSDDGQ